MILWITIAALILLVIYQAILGIRQSKKLKEQEEHHKNIISDYVSLQNIHDSMMEKYSKYDKIIDAEAEAKQIIDNAHADMQQAKISVEKIIQDAHQKAREIAGDALDARDNVKLYEQTAKSLRNIILGYGNDYLIPSHTLLDDLAETYGYTQASKDYKNLRVRVRNMIQNNETASCDYSEISRKQTAINFITDAFNGKADSIIADAKYDNFGTLRQKLTDAFNMVNYNGKAFRNARINNDFFQLRLEELRLACVIAEIHKRDIEEQRRIREQMREEEKARR